MSFNNLLDKFEFVELIYNVILSVAKNLNETLHYVQGDTFL